MAGKFYRSPTKTSDPHLLGRCVVVWSWTPPCSLWVTSSLDGGETHQDDTDIGEPAMDFGATILDSKTLTPHKLHRSFGFGNRCSKAICIGDEVWTVDWHGVVTVRGHSAWPRQRLKSLGNYSYRQALSAWHHRNGQHLAIGTDDSETIRKYFCNVLFVPDLS